MKERKERYIVISSAREFKKGESGRGKTERQRLTGTKGGLGSQKEEDKSEKKQKRQFIRKSYKLGSGLRRSVCEHRG